MTSDQNAPIRATVEPVVEAAGLFLEQCELTGQGGTRTLQVLVDLPDGTEALDLDRVAAVAQQVSDALDREDPVPGPPYELEVSSPGATRALETPRHWRRTVGHLVRIRPLEGERYTARLIEAHNDHAVVQRWHQPKKGMPVKFLDPERVDYAQLRGARSEVEI
ncbi:ribosome maturation factor RimP [Kocuria tytonicola]|uniref:ribosome maturation factor RimP n=1 Tax=Kocuria tytonicola TaxID=2055946 RepID=UPI000EF95583|nr:ribosome maturation factor RimP [Kocuria tytonicola]RLZ03494.1 ribosome maturation factor RimP [Kocuria tytonicola]